MNLKLTLICIFLVQISWSQKAADTCRLNELYYDICHYDENDEVYKREVFTIEGSLLQTSYFEKKGKLKYHLLMNSDGSVQAKSFKRGGATISVGYSCEGKRISKSKSVTICDDSPYPDCHTKYLYQREKRNPCLNVLKDTVWSRDSIYYFMRPSNWVSYPLDARTAVYGAGKYSSTFSVWALPKIDSTSKNSLQSIEERWENMKGIVASEVFTSQKKKFLLYEKNNVNTGLHNHEEKRRDYHLFFSANDITFKVLCSCPRNKIKWFREVFISMTKSIQFRADAN
jgi:hypothetical protein